MIRNFITSLFIATFLGSSILFAQTNQQNKLTTNDGLPSSIIVEMVQDKTGFIWIATNDGLARYDGQKFKIFRNNPKNLNSLIDNKIISLQMTNDKVLLVTQSKNIQLFDPLTEHFITLFTAKFLKDHKATMQKCYLSRDGKHLWGFIQGLRLVHYDFEKKKFTIFSEMALTGKKNSLHDFYFSERGFVFVHCNFGIIQLNTKTYQKRICFYQFDKGKDAIDNIGNGSFAERTNGEMVVPLKKSLLIYNPLQNNFRSIPFPKGEKIELSYTIRKLKDDCIYIGAANRLFRLHPNDSIEVLDQRAKSLFKAYLLDNSNQLWLNNNDGIEKKSLNPTYFQAFSYQKTFKEDLINQLLKIPFHLYESPYAPFFESKQKRSWFIEMNTISSYDFEKKKLLTTPINCCNLTLKLSAQGKLWTYSNYKGLFEIDTLLQVQKLYPNSLLPQFASERGLDVSDIQPVKNGVWVASDNSQGLFFYDTKKQKYTYILQNDPTDSTTLSNNSLQCLQLDPFNENLLWIGTVSEGLCRLNIETLKVTRILEKDGLPNGTILSIRVDSKGFLWCSTNKGLVRINPKTMQMRSFTQADGLQDNEFVRNLSAKLPDGRLVFGGRTGMTIFNPLIISEVRGNLPVVLTSLKINNEIAEIGGLKSPLSTSIHSLKTLELDYNQNFLTFEFAGLEFAKPQQIQYKYRLLGVDENWVNSDIKGLANYTQLSTGKYTFELLSTNADGVWGKKSKKLNVIIHAPWWATWWAYSFYILVVGGVIYWLVQNRLKQLEHQQEMALKRQESAQFKAMDDLKTRFFSNITHELRTPLTLILSPSEKLMRETKHDDQTRRSLFSINRNAQKLLRLINQLLDLSKLESNGMQISLSRGNFNDFMVEIVDNFHNQAIEKNIELTFTSKIDSQERLFDTDKIEKIIYNLLSNALKFSEKGQVKIECHPIKFDNPTENSNSMIEIQISDTGIGISDDKIPHIFDRFFQVEDERTRRYEGTGIGLSLVKELIELMNGTISVQSKVGKGTIFSLIIPLAIADNNFLSLPVISINKKDIFLENQAITIHNTSALDEAKPLIIIIEDNNDLRDFIAEILSPDYRILTAVNGFEGWEIIQQEIPDLVLSDVMMPFMDGYELCEKIKEDTRTNHIAVILLTARSSHEKRVEGLTLGADDYLTKPFHADELCLRINNLLAHQQKLRTYYYHQFNLPEIPLESQPITDPFIQRLYDILEQRLDDSLFSVEELSTEIGMSRRTLHRKLKATTNLSANELIRTYRLKKAAILLKSGKNVSETAYLVGFDSPSYFSTSFKEFFQKTPSEYISNF